MVQALQMIHSVDPKQEITDDLSGYLDGIRVQGVRVMVATYIRPKVTASGIHLSSHTTDEDLWQSKVGLVVAVGEQAFKDDPTHTFGSAIPKLGDWVVFRIGDAFSFMLGKRHMKTVADSDIHLVIPRPDMAY